ncbi:mechanosensitive ion channel domain-containing protein [Metallosphaera hakonensis]|nr:mechanosensitive ion channel domain-containing protein [Metallosphaera hakonensis]
MYIVLYVIVAALINNLMFPYLESLNISLPSFLNSASLTTSISGYQPYINVLLSLLFGYLILQGFVSVVYWNLRLKYDHPTSASVRSVLRLVGLGALVAAIAGGVAGGVAGVALGGFLGIVIGFASQQVLGQAVAGLFLLLSRPFKIKDHVSVTGDEGTVEEITTLFTYVLKSDGTTVIIPNNSILGNKIYVFPQSPSQQTQQGQAQQK